MQNDLVRTSNLFGSPKNMVGNTQSDLILESLGKIYVKTGKQTRLLNDLFKLLDKTFSEPAEAVSNKVIITQDLKTLEYPYDGALIYDSKQKALYIAYQQRYLLILDNIDPEDGSIGYVKKKGDTMSGQLTIRHRGAPLIVASSELVENFNANYLEGHNSDYFAAKSLNEFITGSWTFRETTSFDKNINVVGDAVVHHDVNVGNNVTANGSIHSMGNLSTDSNLEVAKNATIKGDVVLSGNIGSPSFMSGYNGYGWRFDAGMNMLTIDYLVVRKAMQVYELVVNKISATNGSLWVTDSVEVEKVYPVRFINVSNPNYQLYVNENCYYVPYLNRIDNDDDTVSISSKHLASASGKHGNFIENDVWEETTKKFICPKYICRFDQFPPSEHIPNIFTHLKTKDESNKFLQDYITTILLFQSQIQGGIEEKKLPDIEDSSIWYDEYPYNKTYIAEKGDDPKVLGEFEKIIEYENELDDSGNINYDLEGNPIQILVVNTYINGVKYILDKDKEYVYTQARYDKYLNKTFTLNADGTYAIAPFSYTDQSWVEYIPEQKVSGQVWVKYTDNTIEIVTSPAKIDGVKYTVQDYFQMEFFVPQDYNSSTWRHYNNVYNTSTTPTFISAKMQETFSSINELQEIYLYYKYYGIEYTDDDSFNPQMYVIRVKDDTHPTLKEGDLIRCQKFENNNIKYYDAIVMAQFDTYNYVIKIATSVFDKGTKVEYNENGKLQTYEEFIDRTMYNKTEQQTNITDSETLTERQYKEVYGEDPLIANVQPKDGLVRIGNLWNPDRQNSVYITSSENQSPYIRTLSKVNRPDYTVLWSTPDFKSYTKLFKLVDGEWVINTDSGQIKQCYFDVSQNKFVFIPNINCEINKNNDGKYITIYNVNVRAQFGNLEGIVDPMFGSKQPYGYGLFADNVFLKGEFYLNNGQTVVDFATDQALLQSKEIVLEAVKTSGNLFIGTTGEYLKDYNSTTNAWKLQSGTVSFAKNDGTNSWGIVEFSANSSISQPTKKPISIEKGGTFKVEIETYTFPTGKSFYTQLYFNAESGKQVISDKKTLISNSKQVITYLSTKDVLDKTVYLEIGSTTGGELWFKNELSRYDDSSKSYINMLGDQIKLGVESELGDVKSDIQIYKDQITTTVTGINNEMSYVNQTVNEISQGVGTFISVFDTPTLSSIPASDTPENNLVTCTADYYEGLLQTNLSKRVEHTILDGIKARNFADNSDIYWNLESNNTIIQINKSYLYGCIPSSVEAGTEVTINFNNISTLESVSVSKHVQIYIFSNTNQTSNPTLDFEKSDQLYEFTSVSKQLKFTISSKIIKNSVIVIKFADKVEITYPITTSLDLSRGSFFTMLDDQISLKSSEVNITMPDGSQLIINSEDFNKNELIELPISKIDLNISLDDLNISNGTTFCFMGSTESNISLSTYYLTSISKIIVDDPPATYSQEYNVNELKWVYTDYTSRGHMYTRKNCYAHTTTGLYTYYNATHFLDQYGNYLEFNTDYPSSAMLSLTKTSSNNYTYFDADLYVYLDGDYKLCNCYKTRCGSSSFTYLTRGSHIFSTQTNNLLIPNKIVLDGKYIDVTTVYSGGNKLFYFGIRLPNSKLQQIVYNPSYTYNNKVTKFKTYLNSSQLNPQQITDLASSKLFNEQDLIVNNPSDYTYCYFCTPYNSNMTVSNTTITLQYEKTKQELTHMSFLRPNGLFLRNSSAQSLIFDDEGFIITTSNKQFIINNNGINIKKQFPTLNYVGSEDFLRLNTPVQTFVISDFESNNLHLNSQSNVVTIDGDETKTQADGNFFILRGGTLLLDHNAQLGQRIEVYAKTGQGGGSIKKEIYDLKNDTWGYYQENAINGNLVFNTKYTFMVLDYDKITGATWTQI